jgi:hypothetical protein
MNDNSIGTWVRNIGKSYSTPAATNPPTSATLVHTALDGGVWATSTGALEDGTPINISYTLKYDGTDYPAIGQVWDTISMTQADENTFIFKTMKAGKKYSSGRTTVNGTTMTTEVSGYNAEGKLFSNTIVYDKSSGS